MNNRICLIVCWYGKLPYYYKLWEKSCSYNENIDFLVFTDQDYSSKYKNIIFHKKSLSEMEKLFSKKLKMEVHIESGYKFCDLRPSFGIVFDDYVKKYDFWGHCDLDQIFGDTSKFLTDSILSKYDKINKNGHFVLYRNIDKMNHLFQQDGAVFSYKEVFSSKNNYAFDEYTGINKIVEKNNIKVYQINDFSDIDVKHKRFINCNMNNYKKQFYVFVDGKLYMYYINNKINKIELMYLHFQKKKPLIEVEELNKFMISSKGFTKYHIISKESFDLLNKYPGFIYETFETIKYYILKILNFFKCNREQKKIWINQKRKR